MAALQAAGLEPALDLLHFGLPDDIPAVGDPRLVGRFEHYAAAVAERYPWVIVGLDYYRGHERLVTCNGRLYRAGPRRLGFYRLARAFHARYGMPFMLTETNIGGHYAPGWLAEVWNYALRLNAEGLPIRGFCWYGFVDHVDWDSFLTRNRGRTNHCGLVGLDRKPHRVGMLYRELALAAREGRLEPLSSRPRPRRAAPAPSVAA